MFCLEHIGNPVDDAIIEIVAAQEGVAIGAQHFKHAFTHVENGDIKSAAAEIIDSNFAIMISTIDAIGESGCGWLIDDAQDFESGDLASIFRGLSLGVIEVCGHGHNGLGDRRP